MKIEIRLPKGYMNCRVTKSNKFVADTNNSGEWDEIKVSLPRGRWHLGEIDANRIIRLRRKGLLER